jgi:heavy metal sensor kinase
MFFEKILKLRHTLAFRLTLWYAGIFTVSLCAAFLLLYLSIASITQKRTDHELSGEIAEFSSLLAANGMAAVIENINIEAASNGVEEMFLCVVTADGREIASSNRESWKGIGISGAALKRLAAGEDRVFAMEKHPLHRHGIRVIYGAIGPGTVLQIAQSLTDDEELLEIVREIFVITLVALMLPAALIGWFMARRALQGVEEVTRTATEISTGAFELRVPTKARGDEIDRLATTFNSMLDRIHALITGMREMTDNIAHDLRSPITRIRGIAEMTLTTQGSLGDYQTMAANTIEECDRLLEMINTMLDITEVEAGAAKLKAEEVDVSALAREACELFQPLADDKGIALITSAQTAHSITGDIQRLQRMVANLLDNALKYTAARGTVTVSVNEGRDAIVISVSDSGIGISEIDLPHIFKRFYRCDQSRSQAGTGLGLSLAQAIAAAHGGSISVTSSQGQGSTFTVTLPKRLHSR